jgi:photosystem II stability/assembly factor-like uncharacterized protein
MCRIRWIVIGLLSIVLSLSLAACRPELARMPTQQPVSVPPTSAPTSPPTATHTPRPTATPQPTRQTDYGSWKLVVSSKPNSLTYAAGFHNESYGLTVGYSGDVRYTTDGGQNWARADNVSMCRFGLDIVDTRIAWHCGNGGAVRLSVDGGRTWGKGGAYGPNLPNHCRFLSFLDDKTGWAATPSMLGMTADGGETWTDLVLAEGIDKIAAIALRTPSDGYVLDVRGRLFTTQDGGHAWIMYSLGLKDGQLLSTGGTPTAAMRFLDDQRGIVVYQIARQVWAAQSTDGGQTWQHELIPGIEDVYAFYLAHDGRLLTLFDAAQVVVLQHRG